jgi:hypothetical protein
MSDRLLKILVGALAILVIAWGAARLFSAGGGSESAAPFDLSSLADGGLDSMVVQHAEGEVRLRAGEPWMVNGREALAESSDLLARAIEEARFGGLVSRNPENHERLGVGAGGRRLTLYGEGDEPVALILGGRAQVFDQAYVRAPGSDEVYTLKGSLVNLANREAADWRDKQIFMAARGEVRRIEYDYPDESFALVWDTAAWHVEPSGATVDNSTMSGLVGEIARMQALGFAEDAAADTLDWESPTGAVRVYGLDGGRLVELLFLDRGEVGYYVRRDASPIVYTIASYIAELILKREADLVAGPG